MFVVVFAAMQSCYHVPIHNQEMVGIYEPAEEEKNPLQNDQTLQACFSFVFSYFNKEYN